MQEPNHQYLATLVLETRKGNNNAFTELYAPTYDKVYNYSRHYPRDDYIDSNPESRAEINDETRRLHRAIESLPLNEQQVIVMRYFNNMKLDDIADATGFSTSSVKRYLKTGEAALKHILGKRSFSSRNIILIKKAIWSSPSWGMMWIMKIL